MTESGLSGSSATSSGVTIRPMGLMLSFCPDLTAISACLPTISPQPRPPGPYPYNLDNGINGNAFFDSLKSKRPGKTNNPMLRGTIRRNVGIAAQTHSRGDIDDTRIPHLAYYQKPVWCRGMSRSGSNQSSGSRIPSPFYGTAHFSQCGVIDKNSDVTLRLLGTNEACFNIRLLRHISHRRIPPPRTGTSGDCPVLRCHLHSPSEAGIGAGTR